MCGAQSIAKWHDRSTRTNICKDNNNYKIIISFTVLLTFCIVETPSQIGCETQLRSGVLMPSGVSKYCNNQMDKWTKELQ